MRSSFVLNYKLDKSITFYLTLIAYIANIISTKLEIFGWKNRKLTNQIHNSIKP